jgi:hypothetical protein
MEMEMEMEKLAFSEHGTGRGCKSEDYKELLPVVLRISRVSAKHEPLRPLLSSLVACA